MKRLRRAVAVVALGAASSLPLSVSAHSASDAYLSLVVPAQGSQAIEGQWDIALRDLNFVLKLDADGDGTITWGEVRKRQADIERLAYGSLTATMGNAPCAIEPLRQQVTDHADGSYAALFFRIACKERGAQLALDYRLFFAVDPTHRGILVLRTGTATATSLLSPDNARVSFPLAKPASK